jgi:RNA polymerase sigma-70 factor (ECF subfamily)
MPAEGDQRGGLESDRAWLDAFRRGERSALARVFDTYVEDVARTLRAGVVVQLDGVPTRLGADLTEPDVEVLIQETFTKAFAEKARLAYDGLRPYGAYLGAIARNALIDRGRSLVRDAVVDLDVGRLAGPLPDPERVAQDRELVKLVGAFADALDEPDKSVFRLRLVEQKGSRETGQEVGLTEMQVRRRDARLKQELLAFLQRHGFLRQAPGTIGSSLLPRKRTE